MCLFITFLEKYLNYLQVLSNKNGIRSKRNYLSKKTLVLKKNSSRGLYTPAKQIPAQAMGVKKFVQAENSPLPLSLF